MLIVVGHFIKYLVQEMSTEEDFAHVCKPPRIIKFTEQHI